MKTYLAGLVLLALFLVSVPVAEAKSVSVHSYVKRSSGTYVSSYHRTSPNKTKYDNYSTKGNYNPYTGKYGTKNL